MPDKNAFIDSIKAGYSFKGESFPLGAAMLEEEVLTGTIVQLPLKTMNRHGLIAGATGTGKTKTLQVIAEGLSDASVPVLMMDIKGDLSGIAEAGIENDKIKERYNKIGITWSAKGYPVELMSLSNEKGVRLRATVTEFGPILISKILGLNDTQQGLVAMIFKYCDDNKIPLLDLKDFTKIIALLSYPVLNRLKKRVDPRKYNGAILLGLNGLVVKSHGGADAYGFYYALLQAHHEVESDVITLLRNYLSDNRQILDRHEDLIEFNDLKSL